MTDVPDPGAPGGPPPPARQPRFPFSAVVGQDDLKLALILVAVDPRIGGVLLRGQKGSAKTTLARALAALLPGDAPFAELPLGATEDRLVGTLDLAAALTGGERRFDAGLLAAAHGGVLYVDEVNLLPDHLVDVLLDVAASGVNRVEREGVSHEHPSRFVLIGSMNPEEGELRPQLLDRYGLAVEVFAPTEPALRAEAVRRRLAFDADPAGFVARWHATETTLAGRLAAVRSATVDDDLLVAISTLCAAVGAEGLRADLVVARAAAALAGWESRPAAGPEDVRRVAALALAHRRRRGPFDDPTLAAHELEEALAEALGERPPADPADPIGAAEAQSGTRPGEPPPGAGTTVTDRSDAAEAPVGSGTEAAHGSGGASGSGAGADGDDAVEPAAAGGARPSGSEPAEATAPGGPPTPALPPGAIPPVAPGARPLDVGLLAAGRPVGGDQRRGRRSEAEAARGRLVGDRPVAPGQAVTSLALGATVRAVAARRQADPTGPAVVRDDLRQAVRRQRAGALIVVAVDASGSMGAQRRLDAAKGAVVGLLLDAYQRRDRVAMVTFAGERADVVLRPTASVEVARNRLADLPSGGRTPLATGLQAALEVALSAGAGGASTSQPLLVAVTDGRATWAPPGLDPWAAALAAADRVRRAGVAAAVVDAESGPTRLGLARHLAAAMDASYVLLADLDAADLEQVVRAARPG